MISLEHVTTLAETLKPECKSTKGMKLGEIYRLIVDMGIKADPRGEERIEKA
ncbi:MAG: hypothetical protein ACXACD_17645 [Candidatus Thorarchaeota archaeon]